MNASIYSDIYRITAGGGCIQGTLPGGVWKGGGKTSEREQALQNNTNKTITHISNNKKTCYVYKGTLNTAESFARTYTERPQCTATR